MVLEGGWQKAKPPVTDSGGCLYVFGLILLVKETSLNWICLGELHKSYCVGICPQCDDLERW